MSGHILFKQKHVIDDYQNFTTPLKNTIAEDEHGFK